MRVCDELRRLLTEATPVGDWYVRDGNEGTMNAPFWEVANPAYDNPTDDTPWLAVELHTGNEADARLIAAAVNALPDLLDQLDSMEAELADYRAEDRRKRESAEMRRRDDARCYRCGLRYAEREDYSCERRPSQPHLSWGHMFDHAELTGGAS